MSVEIFDSLVRLTMIGSVAILVVLALRGVLRRMFGAQLAYASWSLVPAMTAVMLLPAPTRPIESFVGVAHIAAAASAAQVPIPEAFDLRPLLMSAWLLGALVTAAAFALQQRSYLRGLGRLKPFDGVRIVQSESDLGGPALVGAWRPRIVLPADFGLRYTDAERELILAHERVHLRRGDAWINAIVAAVRCLNWFNPLLHYAAVKLRFDQELACDAAVIARFPEARRRYAGAMLKVQLAGQSRQELRLPVGCQWPSNQNLKERILMLKQPRPRRAMRVAGLSLLAGATSFFAYAAWASQSPRPGTVVTDDGAQQVEVNLRVDAGGKRGKPLRLIQSLGKSFEIADDDGAGAYRAQFTTSAATADSITLEGSIRSGDRILSTPNLVLKPGEPFSFALNDGPQGPAIVRIEGTLAFAGKTPPREEGDRPSTEAADVEATYRSMTNPPIYPLEAAKNRVEGTVFVAAAIAADGSVQDAQVDHVVPETSAAALGEAAVTSVKSWTFNPARRNGQATTGKVVVPVEFFLHEADVRRVPNGGPGAPDTVFIAADRKD